MNLVQCVRRASLPTSRCKLTSFGTRIRLDAVSCVGPRPSVVDNDVLHPLQHKPDQWDFTGPLGNNYNLTSFLVKAQA